MAEFLKSSVKYPSWWASRSSGEESTCTSRGNRSDHTSSTSSMQNLWVDTVACKWGTVRKVLFDRALCSREPSIACPCVTNHTLARTLRLGILISGPTNSYDESKIDMGFSPPMLKWWCAHPSVICLFWGVVMFCGILSCLMPLMWFRRLVHYRYVHIKPRSCFIEEFAGQNETGNKRARQKLRTKHFPEWWIDSIWQ